MIKINNQEYDKFLVNVSWGKFNICRNGIKKSGISPIISFNINNKIFIRLELLLEDKKIKSMGINEFVNINNEISDITFEDKNGWISIIDRNFDCNIMKIMDDKIKFYFILNSDDMIIEINDEILLGGSLC